MAENGESWERGVIEKLATEALKGVARKAGEHTTNLTIKHIAKHAKRISVQNSDEPFGGTRIHIAKKTEFREGNWNEAKHKRGAGGRFGSGTQAHGNPNRIPKGAGPVKAEPRPVPHGYEPSLGVKVAAGAIVAGGVGILGYGAWQVGAALANRNSALFRGLATLGKGMRFSEWDEAKHARNHGRFAKSGMPTDGNEEATQQRIIEIQEQHVAHKVAVKVIRQKLREVRKSAPGSDASVEELREYADRKTAAIEEAARKIREVLLKNV